MCYFYIAITNTTTKISEILMEILKRIGKCVWERKTKMENKAMTWREGAISVLNFWGLWEVKKW